MVFPHCYGNFYYSNRMSSEFSKIYMDQVTEVWLSCYLVLLSTDNKITAPQYILNIYLKEHGCSQWAIETISRYTVIADVQSPSRYLGIWIWCMDIIWEPLCRHFFNTVDIILEPLCRHIFNTVSLYDKVTYLDPWLWLSFWQWSLIY